MTAIFRPEGHLFRATEQAGGPWSPDMLQGSATTALMTREVERLATPPGLRCAASPSTCGGRPDCARSAWKPTCCATAARPRRMQVRLLDGETEIGRCTALLTAQGSESPADPFSKAAGDDAAPETGTPPPAFAQKWSRYFQNVSVRLIEGALEKPGPAAAWMRLDVPMVEGEANTPLLQAVQAADFSSGVGQIVDMREWTFINPEISLYFFRPPEGDWILIRSRTRAGANGAGLTMATLSDRKGAFAEVMQAMTFERRAAQAS